MKDGEIRSFRLTLDEIQKRNGEWSDMQMFCDEAGISNYDIIARDLFTGLHDLNGEEIYDNDILESRPKKDVHFIVSYGFTTNTNTYGWLLVSKRNKYAWYAMDSTVKKMCIIGRHDNLKTKRKK
jgi:hypothetical protein